jgi:aromatic ring-cleaving dioxygenase
MGAAAYHAHVYYSDQERPAAEALQADFGRRPDILFVPHDGSRGGTSSGPAI